MTVPRDPAAVDGVGDEDDDAEPYCATCGQWIGMFHGLDGWRHFQGDPAPGGQRELYDAGHEAAPAWRVPPGRALPPADLELIRQALADASAWRSWQAEGAQCEECQQLDPGRCARHVADDELATSYEALLRRLAD
jgi:hypothetical protein